MHPKTSSAMRCGCLKFCVCLSHCAFAATAPANCKNCTLKGWNTVSLHITCARYAALRRTVFSYECAWPLKNCMLQSCALLRLKTQSYVYEPRHPWWDFDIADVVVVLLPSRWYASTILHQISRPLLEIIKRWTSLGLCSTTTGYFTKRGVGVWSESKPAMGAGKKKSVPGNILTQIPELCKAYSADTRTVNYVCGSLLKKLWSSFQLLGGTARVSGLALSSGLDLKSG
jgi:hypothetical protein